MSDFNYQEYLKNNPLLKKEEVKDQLITENITSKDEVNENVISKIIDKVKSVVQKNISKLGADTVEDIKTKVEKALGKPISQLSTSDINLDNAKKVASSFGINEASMMDKYPKFFGALGLGGLATSIGFGTAGIASGPMVLVGIAAMIVAFISTFEKDEVEETVTEEFSEFKTYDDVMGGIIVRLGALEDYIAVAYPEKMSELQKIITMVDNFDEDMAYGGTDEIEESKDKEEMEEYKSSKMKVSELKAKIKEDIIALLAEQDKEEDVEVEDEVEVEDTIEEPALDAADSQEGLTADEKEIQDSLKVAYDNAVAIGDTKLADQIGNSITFFTRTHVVER